MVNVTYHRQSEKQVDSAAEEAYLFSLHMVVVAPVLWADSAGTPAGIHTEWHLVPDHACRGGQ